MDKLFSALVRLSDYGFLDVLYRLRVGVFGLYILNIRIYVP